MEADLWFSLAVMREEFTAADKVCIFVAIGSKIFDSLAVELAEY